MLVLREGGKLQPVRLPPATTRRRTSRARLTFEVASGSTPRGEVVGAARRGAVQRACSARARARSRSRPSRSALLWSIVNPAHEERVGELLERALPGRARTRSRTGSTRSIREYRRASSAAIDASLKPLMQGHLRAIEVGLRRPRASQASCWSPHLVRRRRCAIGDVAQRPIYSVNSGPVDGAGGRRRLYAGEERRRDRLRHGRNELRRQPRARRLPEVHPRDLARRALHGPHDRALRGRRQDHRRRRRLDRLDRLRRAAAGRPAAARAPIPGPACYGRGGERRRRSPTRPSCSATSTPSVFPRRPDGARRGRRAARRSERCVAAPLGLDVERRRRRRS